MALTDESSNGIGAVMPVSPMGYGNGSNGGFGGDWGSWIILFLIFGMFNGGWGGYGMGGFGSGLGYDFPWLLNGQNGINANTNAGFAQAATQSAISGLQNSVTSGFGDVQLGIAGVNQNICQTGSGITAAINNGFSNAEIAANARQIADMQQNFASQTAITGAINGLSNRQADCCCENRLATCQTQNIIQNEANATRFADANNTRDLLTALNGGIQSIKDQLCDYRNEQKDDTIAQLRSELMYARGQASQDVQTAAIQAGQRALANEVEQYVLPTPRPAYIVQNPNCCYNSCGCNGGF